MAYNPADLSSILSTLSTLTKPPPPAADEDNDDNDAYEPPEPAAPAPAPAPTRTPISAPTPNKHPAPLAEPDPTRITTWPLALQHIMRTVALHESTQRRIRRLIRNQHEHERHWWDGRVALVRKLGSRDVRRGELVRVLQSVGAPVQGSMDGSTPHDDTAELASYDAKVYNASTQMADALVAELKALGVPFFSISPSIVRDGQNGPPAEATLASAELRTLQRRMLELLQDLCRES
ncbi:hypothetical protein PHISP_06119 [Aspergillus sp. HF37]|nr:hypothetical protein PHISP_06119 [Aspergillus sp. HF37]